MASTPASPLIAPSGVAASTRAPAGRVLAEPVDGTCCLLEDLSGQGTLVAGKPMKQAELLHRIGADSFTLDKGPVLPQRWLSFAAGRSPES